MSATSTCQFQSQSTCQCLWSLECLINLESMLGKKNQIACSALFFNFWEVHFNLIWGRIDLTYCQVPFNMAVSNYAIFILLVPLQPEKMCSLVGTNICLHHIDHIQQHKGSWYWEVFWKVYMLGKKKFRQQAVPCSLPFQPLVKD